MSQSVPLSWVLLLLAGVVGGILIYKVVQAIRAFERRIEDVKKSIDIEAVDLEAVSKALVAVTVAVNQMREALVPAAEEMRVNMGAVPKLLETVARVGQAQLEMLQKQRVEQEEKGRNPFGKPNAPAPPRDVTAANLEYEVSTMMRAEGVSREEALIRLNPANETSVWDGGSGILEGWGR